MIQSAVWATEPCALEAAEAALAEHGTAADAVVAGWFALAGEHPGVLLAPIVALVVGPGIGARAYDGRAAQPGAGVPRPRGTREEPTAAARAAVPRGFEMVLLLAAEAGKATLATQSARGVQRASALGATKRAHAVERLGALGAPAIRSGPIAESLVRVAGVNAGGLLTADDLVHPATPSMDAAASHSGVAGVRVLSAPWPSAGATGPAPQVILATDSKGVVAALASYPRGRDTGATLRDDDYELELPLFAEPVRRGVPRVAPGTRLPLSLDLAILDAGAPFRAALTRTSGGLDLDTLTEAVVSHELPLRALAELPFAHELRAVTATPDQARVWSGG